MVGKVLQRDQDGRLDQTVAKHVALTDAEQEAIAGVGVRLEAGWRESALARIREAKEEEKVPAEIGPVEEAARQRRQEAHWIRAFGSGIAALIGTLIGAAGSGGPGLLLFVFFLMLWLPIFAIVETAAIFELRKEASHKLHEAPPVELPPPSIPPSLSEFLVCEGWELSSDMSRLPSPARLNTMDGMIQLARRITPWGSQHFVQISPKMEHNEKTWKGQQQSLAGHSTPTVFGDFWGILALIDGVPGAGKRSGKYVHVKPEWHGKDSVGDVDLESSEFNNKYRVDRSSDHYAYQVLSPSTLALLIDTYDYPDDLFGLQLRSEHPRFEYHVEPSSVMVFRHRESDAAGSQTTSPFWSDRDEFIFLDGQFSRFFATLPGGLRGGSG